MMKTNRLYFLGIGALAVVGLASCNNKNTTNTTTTGEVGIIHETKFNTAYITLTNDNMKALGFEFGDSCDITYSNGKKLTDVPYYDGYYTRSDYPLICGYQGYPYVQLTINNCSQYWDMYELDENVKATVTLNEKAKYINVQNAFSMKYSNDANEFTSNEEFANFREMKTSNLKDNVLYRGASPFNNTYLRANTVDTLLRENNIDYVLDLADSEADFDKYEKDGKYATTKAKSLLNMGSNFRDTKYKESLVTGLKDMMNYEAPYYVHCTEGKDRTGFVCALLEGLCGATYDEMVNDYMMTYKNYFKMTEDDPKYNAVINLRFDEFFEYLTGLTDINEIKMMNYHDVCANYLMAGGMTEEEVNTLVNKLTK